MRRITITIAMLVALLAGASAAANGVPAYPGHIEVTVDGSDVVVEQRVPSHSHCTITRVDLDTDVEVVIGQIGWDINTLLDAELLSADPACASDNTTTDCVQFPEMCQDCNGDGLHECPGYCYEYGNFELVDECVPVPLSEGEREYEYIQDDCIVFGESKPLPPVKKTVLVPHVDDCQTMVEDDDAAGGCTCSQAPPRAMPWLLGAVMMLGGVACLARGRRRPRSGGRWFGPLAGVLALLAGHPAAANPPPSPGTISVMVVGPDVHVQQDVPERSWCTVIRRDPETDSFVKIAETGWAGDELRDAELLSARLDCHPDYTNLHDCDEFPEECADCDGDGDPECPGSCYEVGRFGFIDECVPVDPAEQEHAYEYVCHSCTVSGIPVDTSADEHPVLVEHVDPCQGAPGDGTDDDGGDAAGTSAGCTFSGTPPRTMPWLLGAAMVLGGVACLALGRHRAP